MKFLKIIIFSFFASGIFSCAQHQTQPAPDLGYTYYPGKIGSYIVYDVDSIVYSIIGNDTLKFKFQIKEKLDTLFTDNEGRPAIKIIRYKKIYNPTVPYSQMSWTVLQDVWMANITKTDVEVVEENLRYTKLAFPLKLNASWNGTAHIDTNAVYTYVCTAYDVPSSYNNLSFSKTLTVNQLYLATAISFQDYHEKYARNIGLINKEITDYSYQDNQGNVNTGHIYQGLHYTMTINSYGVE